MFCMYVDARRKMRMVKWGTIHKWNICSLDCQQSVLYSRSNRISSWTVFYFVKKHLCYFKHFCGINFVSISKKKSWISMYLFRFCLFYTWVAMFIVDKIYVQKLVSGPGSKFRIECFRFHVFRYFFFFMFFLRLNSIWKVISTQIFAGFDWKF